MGRAAAAVAASALLLLHGPSYAGGPLAVGGPGFSNVGQPFLWDASAMPVQYRVDPGPLSKQPNGTIVIDHATGVARVRSMFNNWQNVPTANISYNNAGDILPTGVYTGGPVATVNNFNAVANSCDAGTQSPVIFDADGSIFAGLGFPAAVIGFAGPCAVTMSGHIASGIGAMNGRFQDGVSQLQLTAAQFDEAFTHEFGHFSGLDHSQINEDVLNQRAGACNVSELAGLPLMFPFLHCQARATAGLPTLAPDDKAWISRFYPVTGTPPAGKTLTSATYGTISGTVFFTDGITQAQGVNVIARSTSNPQGVAASVVSGYLFTGNLGQTVTCSDPANPTAQTCTNFGGSQFGSRDPRVAGAYDIPVPAGTYTLEVESISPFFTGGSGVGPLDPPIPNPGQTVRLPNPVTLAAGQAVNVNITLTGTPPRFDSFESARLQPREPPVLWQRREDPVAELRAG